MGAFDNFTPPASGAFSNFTPPAAAPAAPPGSDETWSNFLLRHLAGANQTLSDATRAAQDAMTFGLVDKYLPGVSAQAQADTAAAKQRLGAWSVLPEMAGYAVGPGELGLAGKLGGGILGAAGEGAAAGGLGAFGHDESVAGGVMSGAAIGGAGGLASKAIVNPALGAIMGKTGGDTPAAITSSLKDDRDTAYAKLKDVFYKPNDLLDAMDQAKADIHASDPGGDLVAAAPRSMAAFNSLYTRAADTAVNPTQTAHGILTTIDKLNDIQRNPGPENDIAPVIKDRLNTFLQTANPVNAGLGPGDAWQMLEAAKAAHQQFSNARDLQQWGESLKGFGASPAGPAQNVAESFYNDPNSQAYQALSRIANAGGAPGGQNAYTLTHGVVHPLVESAAFAALPPGVAPLAAAGATFLGAKPALGAALGARSRSSVQNAINAAYPTLTGRSFTPPTNPDAGAALRALLLGPAASGFQ
jgi:hypothetical protein